MARILSSLCLVLIFARELTSIKCYACEPGGNCRKDIKERKCPKEPLLMDKCMLMMDNENEQIARDCTNNMMCETARNNCKQAKEARTGDCDVTCCADDLCNAASTRSLSLWLSMLSFIAFQVLS